VKFCSSQSTDLFKLKSKLHNEEINNLYSSQNIKIRLRRMRWAGRVARIRRTRNVYFFFLENLKERDHFGGREVDGRINLRVQRARV
jgi:hypothetical protein